MKCCELADRHSSLAPLNSSKKIKVAIYKRVSTLDQAREGYSLDAQERALRAYCADHKYEVYDVYADEGISGKDITHRPEMKRLLDDADAEAYDIILIWALSRLTRSVSDLYNTWECISKRGIGLISYTESFDTSTPTGRAMMGLLGVFAQMEREITAERVAAAMEERAMRGLRTCSYILGYDSVLHGGLKVNTKEAEMVKAIYKQYIRHKSFSFIAKWSNKQGYRGKRGSKLSPESIHKILTRPIYCGYYTFHGRPIKPAVGQEVPPILDKRTFNTVQRIIESNTSGRTRERPLVYL
jgi:site-specific DNA recombinase